MLIPWILNKSRKCNIHKVVAGTIQMIKLILSFSIYIKIFFYRVEMSIYIIIPG
jgi:hypothetical protein